MNILTIAWALGLLVPTLLECKLVVMTQSSTSTTNDRAKDEKSETDETTVERTHSLPRQSNPSPGSSVTTDKPRAHNRGRNFEAKKQDEKNRSTSSKSKKSTQRSNGEAKKPRERSGSKNTKPSSAARKEETERSRRETVDIETKKEAKQEAAEREKQKDPSQKKKTMMKSDRGNF